MIKQKNNLKSITLPVKTKVVSWFDKKKKAIFYGIDIKIGDMEWAHVKDDKKPLFYPTKKEAAAVAKQVRESITKK